METFGQRLKSLRKADELKDIATLMEVAPQTLGNYERDRNQPDFEKIWRVCSHFGICPEWLIFGTGPKYRTESNCVQVEAQQNGACPGCAALERVLQLERDERQTLAKENAVLREHLARLEERLKQTDEKGDAAPAPPMAHTA